jgi:VanZ family protein
MHLVVFAGMFVVIFRTLDHELTQLRPRSNIVIGGLITCALGALLEVHQLGIPGRSAEWLDFVADSLGTWLAAFAVWRWMLRSSRRASSEG